MLRCELALFGESESVYKPRPRLSIVDIEKVSTIADDTIDIAFQGKGKLYAVEAQDRDGNPCNVGLYLQLGGTLQDCQIQQQQSYHGARFIGSPIPIDDTFLLHATFIGSPASARLTLRFVVFYD